MAQLVDEESLGNDTILIRQGGQMIELQPARYATEALLQELLTSHYGLLAGAQMDPEQPRRWLLVSREVGIPGESDGPNRWSLDHLFLDQDAIPTLVEVKRSTDSRIRREVVGQLLDYAANGVAYWPVEAIRARFQSSCERRGENADEVLARFLTSQAEIDGYWERVKTNLQAGRVRLIFVADEIPPELTRIIEFLNNQMDPAEVLGIEIRQFAGQGLETYIPRLLGQTEQAKQRKSAVRAVGREWNEQTVFARLEERRGPTAVSVARRILDWARRRNAIIGFGKGSIEGSIIFTFKSEGISYYPMILYSYGKVEIQFQSLKERPRFEEEDLRQQFLDRLNAIKNVAISTFSLEKRPSIELELLADEESFRRFAAALDWFVGIIRPEDAE